MIVFTWECDMCLCERQPAVPLYPPSLLALSFLFLLPSGFNDLSGAQVLTGSTAAIISLCLQLKTSVNCAALQKAHISVRFTGQRGLNQSLMIGAPKALSRLSLHKFHTSPGKSNTKINPRPVFATTAFYVVYFTAAPTPQGKIVSATS